MKITFKKYVEKPFAMYSSEQIYRYDAGEERVGIASLFILDEVEPGKFKLSVGKNGRNRKIKYCSSVIEAEEIASKTADRIDLKEIREDVYTY